MNRLKALTLAAPLTLALIGTASAQMLGPGETGAAARPPAPVVEAPRPQPVASAPRRKQAARKPARPPAAR